MATKIVPIVNNIPAIIIDRTAPEGNAFCIMGAVTKMLKRNGHSDLTNEYTKKAMSGDYNNLCKVSSEYINIKFVN